MASIILKLVRLIQDAFVHVPYKYGRQSNLSVRFLACGVGGRKTSISGNLEFTRGPKPHEVQCEWAIDLSSDHIILILPSYENQAYCG